MAEPVLRLDGVRKSYNVGTPVEAEVLHGIDLVLEPGEFVALIGPSGSGKSTLLHLVGLLERPSDGAHRDHRPRDDDAGRGRAHRPARPRARIHLPVPSPDPGVHRRRERLHAADDRARTSRRRDARRAMELLARVGLEGHEHKWPAQLSGGQQQRVAIARALSIDPPLVLADEPTGNLDTHSADDVFALMREFNRERGITFLVVTHDPRLAQRCDRVVELLDGHVVRDERIRTGAPS
jgi:lipoprotein-releasing system ATP-binding protein